MSNKYLTVEEAADKYNYSPTQIRRYCNDGTLKAHHMCNNSRKLLIEDDVDLKPVVNDGGIIGSSELTSKSVDIPSVWQHAAADYLDCLADKWVGDE